MKNRAGRLSMGQGGNKLVAGLIAALIALTILLVVVLFVINADSQNDQEYISYAGELRVLSQEITSNATEAADGNAEAFAQLQESTRDLEEEGRRARISRPSARWATVAMRRSHQ